jgi:hypothetical protein
MAAMTMASAQRLTAPTSFAGARAGAAAPAPAVRAASFFGAGLGPARAPSGAVLSARRPVKVQAAAKAAAQKQIQASRSGPPAQSTRRDPTP